MKSNTIKEKQWRKKIILFFTISCCIDDEQVDYHFDKNKEIKGFDFTKIVKIMI